MSKSVTPYCQSILSQRKQLWESVSESLTNLTATMKKNYLLDISC